MRINIAFTITFKRVFDKLSNDIEVDRLCTCDSLVIDVESLLELLESQKPSFSIFAVLKGLKRLTNLENRNVSYEKGLRAES